MVAQCMALFGAPSVALTASRRGHDQGVEAALNRMPVTSAVPEHHVVLLDNGRRRLLSSPYHTLFSCIGCRACMRECPTFPYFAADTGMTPRDHLWQAVRGAGNNLEDCVGCGRCKTLCPLDIDLPVMIGRMKGQQPNPQDVFFKRIELLFRLCSATAPVANPAFQTPLVRYPAEWVSGMDHRRVLPRFRRDSFQRWAAARTEHPVGRHKVVYYYGCYVNYTDPELGRAVVGLLERNDCEVAIPAQVCCGVAAFAYGDWDLARRYAQKTIRSLVPWVDQGYRVVVTCPSCALALLRDFCYLLPGDAAAERLAQSTINLSTFVLELAAQGDWETLPSSVPLKVGYHTPCHLRVRGGGADSLALLRLIPALEVVPLDRGCCGLAGSYGMKAAHFDRSLEIGGRVASFIAEQNCQAVSTDCAGCEMQLHALTGLPVFHPAKLLWRSMADRLDDSRSL